MEKNLSDLPENVRQTLTGFCDKAKESFGTNLVSIVLFGSAAEGRLRPTSDVNLMLVLKQYEVTQVDPLRETLRLSYATILLGVMFLLESEISDAAEAFAVKFTDILSRHRILVGTNPFQGLQVSRAATLKRLQQVLVNLTLRMRERYALVSLREEKLVPILADLAGPLRACAMTILTLEGKTAANPKEALHTLTQKLDQKNGDTVLKNISIARELQTLNPGEGISTLLGVLDLLQAIRKYTESMG